MPELGSSTHGNKKATMNQKIAFCYVPLQVVGCWCCSIDTVKIHSPLPIMVTPEHTLLCWLHGIA